MAHIWQGIYFHKDSDLVFLHFCKSESQFHHTYWLLGPRSALKFTFSLVWNSVIKLDLFFYTCQLSILNICTIITDLCFARVVMLLHNKNCITSFIISNAFSCPCPSSFVSCVTFFESLYIEGHIAANTVFNESILNCFWEAKRHEIFMLLC